MKLVFLMLKVLAFARVASIEMHDCPGYSYDSFTGLCRDSEKEWQDNMRQHDEVIRKRKERDRRRETEGDIFHPRLKSALIYIDEHVPLSFTLGKPVMHVASILVILCLLLVSGGFDLDVVVLVGAFLFNINPLYVALLFSAFWVFKWPRQTVLENNLANAQNLEQVAAALIHGQDLDQDAALIHAQDLEQVALIKTLISAWETGNETDWEHNLTMKYHVALFNMHIVETYVGVEQPMPKLKKDYVNAARKYLTKHHPRIVSVAGCVGITGGVIDADVAGVRAGGQKQRLRR